VKRLYDERFFRMWEFYLAGAEMGFRHQGLVVFQIQMTKSVDALPITRDYITDWERENAPTVERFPLERTTKRTGT
jgi:cyclopropane-fatty-acyl-phospholipid synthase